MHASEDVGMANPQAMVQAVAAAQALEFIGMPEETALIFTNLLRVASAMMLASVVFPQPGGPKKMLEVRLSASMARRSSHR